VYHVACGLTCNASGQPAPLGSYLALLGVLAVVGLIIAARRAGKGKRR
jgi:hypothetical protein